MIIYNKAIRDNIPSIIENTGKKYTTIRLSEFEFLNELKKKLQEEINEFIDSEDVSELADIIEVTYAIAELKGITLDELEHLRLQKRDKNGAFQKKLFLVNVEE